MLGFQRIDLCTEAAYLGITASYLGHLPGYFLLCVLQRAPILSFQSFYL